MRTIWIVSYRKRDGKTVVAARGKNRSKVLDKAYQRLCRVTTLAERLQYHIEIQHVVE